LDTSFAKVSIPDLESKCCDGSDEVQTTREEVQIGSDHNDRRPIDIVDEDDVDLKEGKNWKISEYVDGKLTYIHVSQAIKILLPRSVKLSSEEALGIQVSARKRTLKSHLRNLQIL